MFEELLGRAGRAAPSRPSPGLGPRTDISAPVLLHLITNAINLVRENSLGNQRVTLLFIFVYSVTCLQMRKFSLVVFFNVQIPHVFHEALARDCKLLF